jgi:hypothetical protein
MIRRKKGSKMKNTKVVIDDLVFDSKKEANRYSELLLDLHLGIISDLELQKPFVLAPSVMLNGRKKPAIRYVADFCYVTSEGETIVEDVKSSFTKTLPVYRMKSHLMKHIYNIDITEV